MPFRAQLHHHRRVLHNGVTGLGSLLPTEESVCMSVTNAPVTKLTSPTDIVAMIPYVLGFIPEHSLVLVALEGPHQRFGPVMRLDLPENSREAAEQVDYLLALVDAHKFRGVIVVAYTDDPRRSGSLVRPLLRRLKRARISVSEALRADGERWYSYTCHKVCCPASGVPYQADNTAPAAQAVYSGLTRADSRDALRAMFDPAPPEAVADLERDCRVLLAEPEACRPDDREIRRLLEDVDDCEPRHLATLLALAQDETWIAEFLMAMTRFTAQRHFDIWRSVMCVAPPDLMAGPGALAAFAAWLDGHGVLASHACDRVEEMAPGHSLIVMVRSLLDHTVPPYVWDEIVGD